MINFKYTTLAFVNEIVVTSFGYYSGICKWNNGD